MATPPVAWHRHQALLIALVLAALPSIQAQQPFDPQGRPNRNQPGPWDNDVLVFRVTPEGPSEQLATFPRAGVPTLARLADGRIMAAHQHFPDDNDADFDKVAVHFSSDEGRTWTPPAVIRLTGLPDGMRFPFDPTLVPLPDKRVRLYFTSVLGRRIDVNPPAIYSAVSANGVDFVVEPGMRFGIAGRQVIDSAVVLHRGVFHLFSPDNGPVGPPPLPGGRPPLGRGPAPPSSIGYHATSTDGLAFTREDDVRVDGARRWLGNAQSDGERIRFFGTGGPGVWTGTSAAGRAWQLDAAPLGAPGADPGAVRARDGAWILAVTGPPRGGTRFTILSDPEASDRVGLALFMYDRKAERGPQIVAGILLMGYPYFVSGLTQLVTVGAVIVVGLIAAIWLGW